MKKCLLYIFYIIVVFLTCLAAIELYCKMKGICTLSQFRAQDFPNNKLFTTSDFLPFELTPNIPGYSNSLGMRDKEYGIEKPKGIYRIIVLGDSVTMYGRYTDYLEDLLNNDFGNKIEVWNCSIGGHGIKDYYYNLSYRCLHYQPDMVIIGFCLNDFSLTPVMFRDRRGTLLCYRPFRLLKGELDNWLYCHSRAYRLILSTLEARHLIPYFYADEPLGRLYLGKIKALAQQYNIPLLTLIFPYFRADSEESIEYKIMKKVIDELNIDCIDLHQVFRKEERLKFLDNSNEYLHPNDAAHRIVAGVLEKYLIDKKIPR
jgi:hypothetical protein